MEGKTSEHVEMVPAEHALEHMPIEKAWFLLGSLTSQVDAKQTELQVCNSFKRLLRREASLGRFSRPHVMYDAAFAVLHH